MTDQFISLPSETTTDFPIQNGGVIVESNNNNKNSNTTTNGRSSLLGGNSSNNNATTSDRPSLLGGAVRPSLGGGGKHFGGAAAAKMRSMRKLTSLRNLMAPANDLFTRHQQQHEILTDDDISVLSKDTHNISFRASTRLSGGSLDTSSCHSLDDTAIIDLHKNPSFRELLLDDTPTLHFDKDQVSKIIKKERRKEGKNSV